MENLVINKRDKTCSKEAKKERKKGLIPGILYGKNINNYMFEVGEIELNNNIRKHGEHGIIRVLVEGEEKKALIKEIQRDPLNKRILHLDLENISEDQKIVTEIPIQFDGENLVSRRGGILQKEKTSIKVECKASEIPKNIEVDLSRFDTGDVFRVSDLEVSEELSIIEPNESVIALVTHTNYSLDDEIEEEDQILSETKENEKTDEKENNNRETESHNE